ncbi:MAG: DUF1127 domain-containing protein [Flavobacteriaceae bacterium]
MIRSDAYDRERRERPDAAADVRRVVVDTVASVIEPLTRVWRNRKRRDELAGLRELDERLLADIGLTPGDVREAFELPLSENASRLLAGRALRSRQAWRFLGRR